MKCREITKEETKNLLIKDGLAYIILGLILMSVGIVLMVNYVTYSLDADISRRANRSNIKLILILFFAGLIMVGIFSEKYKDIKKAQVAILSIGAIENRDNKLIANVNIEIDGQPRVIQAPVLKSAVKELKETRVARVYIANDIAFLVDKCDEDELRRFKSMNI
ncbi:MAG: hypothetical protein E7257_08490 [Lachnospiraceae bacterium]|nr:hypothetical protein [Lachnospiraceae bacterium]